MSEEISELAELAFLPLIILVFGGITLSIWIATSGGDSRWVSDVIEAFAFPAVILGLILAAIVAISRMVE